MNPKQKLIDAEEQVNYAKFHIHGVLSDILGEAYHGPSGDKANGEFDTDTQQDLLYIYLESSTTQEKIKEALKATGFNKAIIRWADTRWFVWDEVISL